MSLWGAHVVQIGGNWEFQDHQTLFTVKSQLKYLICSFFGHWSKGWDLNSPVQSNTCRVNSDLRARQLPISNSNWQQVTCLGRVKYCTGYAGNLPFLYV